MCDISVGCLGAVQVDVSYMMVVAASQGTADIPSVQGVKTYVEGHATVGAPVAVYVFRSGNPTSRRTVVGHHIAYRIGGALPRGIGAETPMALVLRYVEA